MESSKGKIADNGGGKVLETGEEKVQRTKSLIIVYFTLFLQSLGLAIAMTGVWPFLDKVSLILEFFETFHSEFMLNDKQFECHVNLKSR